jgi:hypothetical protein
VDHTTTTTTTTIAVFWGERGGGKVVQLVFKHKMFVTLIVLDVAAVLSTIEKYDKRICCYVIVTFLDVSIYYLLHMNPEEG